MNDSSGVGTYRLLSGESDQRDVDAVGGVHPGGVLAEIPAAQVQHRVRQVAVVHLPLVLELPDVEREDDPKGRHAGEPLAQVLAVALHARAEGPRVHAVGADADGPAPPARAERHHLVEGVEQHRPRPGRAQPFDLRAVRGDVGVREPGVEVGESAVFERGVGVDASEPGPAPRAIRSISVLAVRPRSAAEDFTGRPARRLHYCPPGPIPRADWSMLSVPLGGVAPLAASRATVMPVCAAGRRDSCHRW